MDISNELQELVGKPESSTLEYKAVLPPSKNIAQMINSFANTEGGYIILGVSDNLEVNGLSEDFHATEITHKALDLLTPRPSVHYQYYLHGDKKLYAIKVEKSPITVLLEGKIYKRIGSTSKLSNPVELTFKKNGFERIKTINTKIEAYKGNSTNAQIKFIEHYQSILRIIDDLGHLLYPDDPKKLTSNQEGKTLTRILFSSFVDNFETYLSDLLYEIFLANPSTLKSNQTVTIEEVLNCSDLQEFVNYWSKQKINKLQKGSVTGFIKENKQISDLNIINEERGEEIEKILQIRHLYSHRNGVVDEKFLKHFKNSFEINSEHQMTINELCDRLTYLTESANLLDKAAQTKYSLATGT